MAAATTSPVKILTDLGYEIWEMEIPEDYRSALIEAINTLIMTNPSDGRIPILQEAIKTLQKPKFKAKKTRINISKVLNKTQPRLEGQKLQEDSVQSEDNFLVDRLDNIASSLSEIGGILGSQLSLERIAYERKRRRDLLNEKREREKSLEDEGNTIGKNIKKIIAQPIKSFGERLLQFLKSIALGAAVLSLYKWLQDDENLKKVKAIADWLGNNGGKLIKSLLNLGKLGIPSQLGKIISKVGKVFVDNFLIKPIQTLKKLILGQRLGSSLSATAATGSGLRNLKKKAEQIDMLKIAKAAKKIRPNIKPVEMRRIANMSYATVANKLYKDFSVQEVSKILDDANISKANQIFIKNTIELSNVRKAGFLERMFGKKPELELPSFLKPDKSKKTAKLSRNSVLKLLDDLIKLGIDNKYTKELLKWISGPIGAGLKFFDVIMDVYDSYRTSQSEDLNDKIASTLFLLASVSSSLGYTVPGAQALLAPAAGFSFLGMAFEDDEFFKGLQRGIELEPGGTWGITGSDPFLNIYMEKTRKERLEEKNNQSSLMPNDLNNSGGNISFLGNNGTQSGSGSGNSSGSDVLVNDSENSEDPLIPSVAGVFNSPSALT